MLSVPFCDTAIEPGLFGPAGYGIRHGRRNPSSRPHGQGRLKVVFQLRKSRKGHGLPVRTIQSTASMKRRLPLPFSTRIDWLTQAMRFHFRPFGRQTAPFLTSCLTESVARLPVVAARVDWVTDLSASVRHHEACTTIRTIGAVATRLAVSFTIHRLVASAT